MAQARVVLVLRVALVAAAATGCRGPDTPPSPVRAEAGPADAAASADLEARPLGLPELAAYGWRKRGGQPAFRLARGSEQAGDWAAVATTCQQALAADPGHLEASWLLAVAFAKLGKPDQLLAPLARAEAGDFAKWGQASLELPGLQPFLASPAGAAWRRRVEEDRTRYAAAVARSVIVTADGELYAVELEAGRWYRLTRASGGVIGAIAVPQAHKIAYVTRAGKGARRELGIGLLDLVRGTSSRPVPLAIPGPITVAYSIQPPLGFWIGAGAPRPTWRQLDDEYVLHPLPARTTRPGGAWLAVTARGTVQLHALPPNVTADWDEQSLASAIRIGTSNRVVSVPSPGLIDGNTAAWSADRVHFAFVAQLDDHCTAGATNTAAFVADASSGAARELERAAGGVALQWLAERKIAVAGDHGVAIYGLDDPPGTAPAVIEGATGLLVPRERPRCAPAEPVDPVPDDLEPGEPAAAAVDAGTSDAAH
jgi:hypothetical protein